MSAYRTRRGSVKGAPARAPGRYRVALARLDRGQRTIWLATIARGEDIVDPDVAKFDLPVRLRTTVTRLTRADEGYLAEATSGPIGAKQVVVATGPFQVPSTPPVSEQLDPELPQLHSSAYRRPEDLPEGRVLAVGGANSGQQIALELSESRSVEISVGQKLPTLPQRPLGRDIWWWLTATRLARVPVSSRLGQRLSQRDVVIGGGLKELAQARRRDPATRRRREWTHAVLRR